MPEIFIFTPENWFPFPGRIPFYNYWNKSDAADINVYSTAAGGMFLNILGNIDFKQMDVGGDDNWGAKTHEQYGMYYQHYAYIFTLQPLFDKAAGQDSIKNILEGLNHLS